MKASWTSKKYIEENLITIYCMWAVEGGLILKHSEYVSKQLFSGETCNQAWKINVLPKSIMPSLALQFKYQIWYNFWCCGSEKKIGTLKTFVIIWKHFLIDKREHRLSEAIYNKIHHKILRLWQEKTNSLRFIVLMKSEKNCVNRKSDDVSLYFYLSLIVTNLRPEDCK